MSFASILSEPATQVPPIQDRIFVAAKSSQMPATEPISVNAKKVKLETEQYSPPAAPLTNAEPKPMPKRSETPITKPEPKAVTKPRKTLTAKEHESISRAMEAIESQPLSDVEESDFASEKERYTQKGRKRVLELEEEENVKRKVRAPCHDHGIC